MPVIHNRKSYKRKVYKKKAAAAAAAGALWAVIVVFVRFKYQWISVMISYVVISSLMILICYPVKSLKKLLARVLVLYANAFVFGGILNTVYFNMGIGRLFRTLIWGRYKSIFLIALLGFAVTIFICRILKNYEQQIVKRNNTYSVTLVHNGKSVDVKALYDTGNCLREPFTKRPVSICTGNAADILMEGHSEMVKNIMSISETAVNLEEKIYVVPFVSVGNENGLIAAVEINSMRIHMKGKTVEKERPLIGFYGGKINGDSSYDLILNSAVLSNETE